MKETDTPRWYGYLQALGRDPWVDWGVTARFSFAHHELVSAGSGGGFCHRCRLYGDFCRDCGPDRLCDRLCPSGAQIAPGVRPAVRFRNVMGNIVVVLYFVVAILLIVWRYLNA